MVIGSRCCAALLSMNTGRLKHLTRAAPCVTCHTPPTWMFSQEHATPPHLREEWSPNDPPPPTCEDYAQGPKLDLSTTTALCPKGEKHFFGAVAFWGNSTGLFKGASNGTIQRGLKWSGCSVRIRLWLCLPHNFHRLLSILPLFGAASQCDLWAPAQPSTVQGGREYVWYGYVKSFSSHPTVPRKGGPQVPPQTHEAIGTATANTDSWVKRLLLGYTATVPPSHVTSLPQPMEHLKGGASVAVALILTTVTLLHGVGASE